MTNIYEIDSQEKLDSLNKVLETPISPKLQESLTKFRGTEHDEDFDEFEL